MKFIRNSFDRARFFFAASALVAAGLSALGQVSPTEVQNPRAKADELGVELKRAPMLNADPRLVTALHALVRQCVGRLSTVSS